MPDYDDRDWRDLVAVLPRVNENVLLQTKASWTGIRILFTLAQGSKAKRVLEIGVQYGYSALVWAYAMRGTPGAEVVGIEIDDASPPASFWELMPDGVKMTVVHESSATATLPPDELFDILFIDGAKTLTISDFDRFSPLVRPGGYVIIDDWPCFWSVIEARSALEARGIKFTALAYNNEYGDGDGNSRLVWKKPGNIEREIEQQMPAYYAIKRRTPNANVDGWTLETPRAPRKAVTA